MLNRDQLAGEVPYLGGKSELELLVEGLRFPDLDFDGLVTINLSLLEPSAPVIQDTPTSIMCRINNNGISFGHPVVKYLECYSVSVISC